ncbi:hypothetical protein LBMAG56_30440 [Verrucomicrobiota bacterium]|nr:hypothetical protein LBMAG56_30440 [Verrucomicrobiota bacterium]
MKPHALVVDDEAIICRVLKTFLTKRGFRVTTAQSSAEVHRVLPGQHLDLVILDADLNGEYGLGLLPTLLAASPRLPVVVYSGVGAESELAGLARDKGAFTLVSKVDSLDVLWAEIQRALPALEKDSAAAAAATKPARAAARR